jgi:hypothetical protein
MTSAFTAFFSWPNGGVWSNLLASLLWGAPAFITHHRLMRRHQTKTIAEQTAKQTDELKAYIDARPGEPRP